MWNLKPFGFKSFTLVLTASGSRRGPQTIVGNNNKWTRACVSAGLTHHMYVNVACAHTVAWCMCLKLRVFQIVQETSVCVFRYRFIIVVYVNQNISSAPQPSLFCLLFPLLSLSTLFQLSPMLPRASNTLPLQFTSLINTIGLPTLEVGGEMKIQVSVWN